MVHDEADDLDPGAGMPEQSRCRLDISTRLLEQIEHFFDVEAAPVQQGQLLDPAGTRRRLEEIWPEHGKAEGRAG